MRHLNPLSILVVALSLTYVQTLSAEPAPQPGSSQKESTKKAKTKEKEALPRVEGSYPSEAEAKKACAEGMRRRCRRMGE